MTETLRRPRLTPAGTREDRPWLALMITVSCTLMLILDVTVMTVALPRIQRDLHFSLPALSWVTTAYTLAFGGLLLLGGRAGDILGRRRVFVAGIALFTAASLAGGLAQSAAWLIAARIVQGIGAAAAGPNTISLVISTFPEARERIRALALMSATASGGFAVGLIVGGLLTQLGSWRWALFINVPIGLTAIVLAPRFIREPQRHRSRLDLAGAPVATIGVAAVVYGLLHAATHGWAPPATWLPLAVGGLSVVAFILIEARAAAPLLPLRLFADRNRAAGYLNFLVGPAAMMPSFFFLTQYLQNVRGYSPLSTGLAFLPLAVGMFAVTRVVPVLLPRLGPKPLVVTGSLVMVCALLWLTRLHTDTGYLTGLLAPLALLGLGGGLAFTPVTPVIMASVPPADTGAAGGTLQTMQQVGSTLGIAVLTTVYGSVVRGGDGSPAASVHAMTVTFAVAAALAGVALLVGLTFRAVRAAAPAPTATPAPTAAAPVAASRAGAA